MGKNNACYARYMLDSDVSGDAAPGCGTRASRDLLSIVMHPSAYNIVRSICQSNAVRSRDLEGGGRGGREKGRERREARSTESEKKPLYLPA